MKVQASTLFDSIAEPPVPDANRKSPVFWVRRLKVIDSPKPDHETIREISFRLGLNIINTEAPKKGDTQVVGHSVGKSLVSRLIRYCLGESSFGDRIVRQSVADFLKHGFVVAEFVFGEKVWTVARPVGLDSSVSASWALEDSWDCLFDETKRVPFNDFFSCISQQVFADTPAVSLPRSQRQIAWPDVLSWLTPDQACAHKSHVEWRPGGPDFSSRPLRKEDCHVVIRTLMDLLSIDDSKLIGDHKSLQQKQGKLSHQVTLKEAVRDHLQSDLISRYSENPDGLVDELLADRILKYTTDLVASLKRLLDDFDSDPVEEWSEAVAKVQREIGGTEKTLERERNDLKAFRAELAIEENPDSNELIKNSELGEWCRLFNTKDEAASHGCPSTSKKYEQIRTPNAGKIAELKQKINAGEQKVSGLEESYEKLEKEAAKSKARLAQARKKIAARENPLKEKIEDLEQLEYEARHFRGFCEQLAKLRRKLTLLKPKIRKSLEIRKNATDRYAPNRRLLARHFEYALSEISGQEVATKIKIDANGISPSFSTDTSYRGEALSTSAVLAFDLSCLTTSVEGVGHHPRFIFHDSPRDADMEVSLYHRLFDFVAGLEDLFDDEPSFQYIITTTTMPPKHLIKSEKEFVRLTLDARKDKGLFLRQRF